MWKYLLSCLMVSMVACTGSKTNTNPDQSGMDDAETLNVPMPNIQGQWWIENVVENDSSYVRPSEIDPEMTAYIVFKDDNSFGIMTNCNHLGGQYIQSNDSISMIDIFTTEMACDNMELEDMLKKILPLVTTVDCVNDSIARLNTKIGESYIVLKKSANSQK